MLPVNGGYEKTEHNLPVPCLPAHYHHHHHCQSSNIPVILSDDGDEEQNRTNRGEKGEGESTKK